MSSFQWKGLSATARLALFYYTRTAVVVSRVPVFFFSVVLVGVSVFFCYCFVFLEDIDTDTQEDAGTFGSSRALFTNSVVDSRWPPQRVSRRSRTVDSKTLLI